MNEVAAQAQEIIEDPPKQPGVFDTRVHIRDAKTGQLVRTQPHRLRVISGRYYYESPKDSGNLFFANNEPAGRWVNGEVDDKAAHIEFRPAHKASAAEIAEENAALRKELAAVKAEREKKAAAPGKQPEKAKEA